MRRRHQLNFRLALLLLFGFSLALLSGCGTRVAVERDGPGSRDVSQVPDAVPRVEPLSRGGNPESYVVFGKRYYPMKSSLGYVERGIASWYGSKFHGRNTSNGEVYDMYRMTAAHKTLPLPTFVEVTNLENGRQVVLRVNDRGPFHSNRIIDLSYAAASRIGMLGKGTALVEVRAIDPRAPQPRVAQTTPTRPQPARPPQRPTTNQVARAPRIFLQAGAFNSSFNAERLRSRLENGLSRSVRIAASGTVHRVQVGPLASVEVADRVAAELAGFGVAEPLVVID